MAGSVFEGYAEDQAREEVKAKRAAAPLSLFGVAVAVLLGNLMTGLIAAVIYEMVK